MSDLHELMHSARKIRYAVAEREITAVEVVRHFLDRIEAIDPPSGAGSTSAASPSARSASAGPAAEAEPLNAVRETYPEEALRCAEKIDASITAGKPAPALVGVPFFAKDNIVTVEGTTTAGSNMLAGYRSPYDATVIARLRAAGAIVLGKVNCDEFAMGSSTENCAWGATRNPWDRSRVPGGSSGGSAAALAAGLAPFTLGSDTGGSIRQPAAFCGVVGFKPSYGRVSRSGLIAFGSSLDQIGPFTNDVRDAAAVFEAIAGHDAADSTTADVGVPDCLSQLDEPIENLVIGVPRQCVSDANDPAVATAVNGAIEVYRSLGARIEMIDLPLTDAGLSTYYVIAPAEASSNLARYDGIRYGHRASAESLHSVDDLIAASRAEGFGPEVQRRIMLGTYVLSAGYYDCYYRNALRVRRLIKEEYDAAFSRCHALLGPTSPTPAFPLGDRRDPLSMYLCDVYTVNANIAGICALSMPAAPTSESALPVGLHLQCRAFNEAMLFRVARMYETATQSAKRRCPCSTFLPS